MIALLNAPILTAYGEFSYEKTTVEEAKALLKDGFISYIGHQSTCDVLGRLLETDILKRRDEYQQKTGEKALIFRLNKRIEEGQVLNSMEEIEAVGYELGILTRIN